MNIKDSIRLMELYAVCPRCGCDVIGNGKGTLECDTAAGSFRRTCSCGWYVEVQEGITAAQVMKVELSTDDEPEPEPLPEAEVNLNPKPEPEPIPDPVSVATSEPAPESAPKADKKKRVDKPVEWKGFVHIRCEACHKEATICLRRPTTQYTCRHCDHQMDLPKPYLAYTHCECGQAGRYLTNIPDYAFDIPCANCGSPNTVTYHPGKDCYVPVGHTQKHGKAKKKK